MAVARQHLSLEEFLQLPEEEPALEFVDGVVRQKVPAKFHHSALQAELVERINAAGRGSRIARAFPELRATLASESRVPDVAAYRWARIPRTADGELVQDVHTPPDITIEIVSPGQSAYALFRRCRWYVSNGVEVAVLVDPEDRSLVAFLADGTVHAWRDSDQIDLGDIVPNFDLTVRQLFEALTG